MMCDMRMTRPFGLLMLLLPNTPSDVPMVSNMSRNKMDMTHTSMSIDTTSLLHSIWHRRGRGDSGIFITESI